MKVKLGFETAASPEVAYEVISDLGFLAHVDADVTKMERLFDGDIQVGSTFREYLALPGMPVVADLTLTELQPGRAVAFSFESKQMKGGGRFDIEARGDGSAVNLTVDATLRGMFRLMWPIVRVEFPIRERKRIRNLAELLESQAVVSA